MAWERRGGNLYSYQSEREGGRVRKRYVGTGEIAERMGRSVEAVHGLQHRGRRGLRRAMA